MKISPSAWADFVKQLSQLDDIATGKVADYITNYRDFDYRNAEHMKDLVGYAFSISNKYGEAAAALACEMYDAVGTGSGLFLPPASPAETAKYRDVAKAVYGTAKNRNTNMVAGSVGRLVKRTGQDTILTNALRDGAQFAWVPNGDTCAFCLTLASRGWQKMSRKALKNGHAEHIHSNCDCTYAVRFDNRTQVPGYNPEKYLEMYNSADGNNPTEKVNAIRRIKYQENKDRINAQKRAAYAAKTTHSIQKKSSSSWAGEPKLNSREQISQLRKYAAEKSIVLDPSFSSFDGDIDLIKDFIDSADKAVNANTHMRNKNVRIGVSYVMDDEVYAETKGSTITVNGFAYRDRALLSDDYQKKVNEKWFTQGSTYLDIATHESGHVIVYLDQLRTSGVIESLFRGNMANASDIIAENISEYASKNENELIAESFVALSNGFDNEYVLKVLQYCGILK